MTRLRRGNAWGLAAAPGENSDSTRPRSRMWRYRRVWLEGDGRSAAAPEHGHRAPRPVQGSFVSGAVDPEGHAAHHDPPAGTRHRASHGPCGMPTRLRAPPRTHDGHGRKVQKGAVPHREQHRRWVVKVQQAARIRPVGPAQHAEIRVSRPLQQCASGPANLGVPSCLPVPLDPRKPRRRLRPRSAPGSGSRTGGATDRRPGPPLPEAPSAPADRSGPSRARPPGSPRAGRPRSGRCPFPLVFACFGLHLVPRAAPQPLQELVESGPGR